MERGQCMQIFANYNKFLDTNDKTYIEEAFIKIKKIVHNAMFSVKIMDKEDLEQIILMKIYEKIVSKSEAAEKVSTT